MNERESCRFCGAEVEPGTTCPRSLDCPRCGAGAGQACKRPSGHRAAELHADRIRQAEELDALRELPAGQLALDAGELLADPADHEADCCCEACTDQWRPEDASYALLEAEQTRAREAAPLAWSRVDRVRSAAGADPRGERDR